MDRKPLSHPVDHPKAALSPFQLFGQRGKGTLPPVELVSPSTASTSARMQSINGSTAALKTSLSPLPRLSTNDGQPKPVHQETPSRASSLPFIQPQSATPSCPTSLSPHANMRRREHWSSSVGTSVVHQPPAHSRPTHTVLSGVPPEPSLFSFHAAVACSPHSPMSPLKVSARNMIKSDTLARVSSLPELPAGAYLIHNVAAPHQSAALNIKASPHHPRPSADGMKQRHGSRELPQLPSRPLGGGAVGSIAPQHEQERHGRTGIKLRGA